MNRYIFYLSNLQSKEYNSLLMKVIKYQMHKQLTNIFHLFGKIQVQLKYRAKIVLYKSMRIRANLSIFSNILFPYFHSFFTHLHNTFSNQIYGCRNIPSEHLKTNESCIGWLSGKHLQEKADSGFFCQPDSQSPNSIVFIHLIFLALFICSYFEWKSGNFIAILGIGIPLILWVGHLLIFLYYLGCSILQNKYETKRKDSCCQTKKKKEGIP